jgi:hypothetical protein
MNTGSTVMNTGSTVMNMGSTVMNMGSTVTNMPTTDEWGANKVICRLRVILGQRDSNLKRTVLCRLPEGA